MFSGWLIKFGDVELPNSFLLADGWKSKPNQRLELDAYRDATPQALLHRETADGFKTTLTLGIRPMNLKERQAFNNVIGLSTLGWNERKQRKVSITYWNDETLEYTSGSFYITDTEYSINTIDDDTADPDISYNEFTLTLIEY